MELVFVKSTIYVPKLVNKISGKRVYFLLPLFLLTSCAQAKKTRQIDQFIAYRKIHPPHTQAHLAAQPTSDRFAAKRAFVFQRTL